MVTASMVIRKSATGFTVTPTMDVTTKNGIRSASAANGIKNTEESLKSFYIFLKRLYLLRLLRNY